MTHQQEYSQTSGTERNLVLGNQKAWILALDSELLAPASF